MTIKISEENDTNALRLFAREYYEKGRIGKAKMDIIVNAADELDRARKEISFSHGKQQKKCVRDFLSDIIANEIVRGKGYSVRIDIDDGGENSYIGLYIATEDFNRKSPVTRGVQLFRHSNSISKLTNTWSFDLGDICNVYADHPDVPLSFTSYGKTADEAEIEAGGYYQELKRLIKKETSDYKIRAAESEQEEKEKLLARLSELGATP